jgi:hypothetical protein
MILWRPGERIRDVVPFRQSPAYTDVTLNFSKSISLLHGSIRENAVRARDSGDSEIAAWWDERDARFCGILQEANVAAIAHLQTWAGVTRTGYHRRQVSGRELGKWVPAEMVGTSWLQRTSRNGDMHDHVHNPILSRVRTLSDGNWRATDTMAIRRQIPAIQATAAAYVEAALSREFGRLPPPRSRRSWPATGRVSSPATALSPSTRLADLGCLELLVEFGAGAVEVDGGACGFGEGCVSGRRPRVAAGLGARTAPMRLAAIQADLSGSSGVCGCLRRLRGRSWRGRPRQVRCRFVRRPG